MRSVPAALMPFVAWAALASGACRGGEAPATPGASAQGGGAVAADLPPGGPQRPSADRDGGVATPPARPPAAATEEIVRAPEIDGDVVLIDVVEVRSKLEDRSPMLLIDARGRADYDQEHIPGAVSVPLPKIAAVGSLPGVPPDYEIVVYCISQTCPLGKNAARALASLGYTNVKEMRAGLVGWKQAGFETERGG